MILLKLPATNMLLRTTTLLAVASLCAPRLANAEPLYPVSRTSLDHWLDDLRSAHSGNADAVKSWTLASGAPYTSIPSNWSPSVTPLAGEDVLFGTLRSGNYAVVQDMGTILGNLTVSRALSTEQIDFSGIFSGASFRVAKGIVNVTVPTFTVTAPGATNGDSSIVVGDGAGASAKLTFVGTAAKYYDARVGVNGSTGTLQITGANTSLVPVARNVTPSVFGGAADAANATILVDAATVEAWVITTGIRGTTTLTNGAFVTSVPTAAGTGQIQIGSPDSSNVALEVSNNADLRISGADGVVLIGSGVAATTNTRIQTGGSIVADFVITGAETVAGAGASNNTINIAGVGSLVTTTEAFDTNGGYRFSNVRRGATTINVTAGGKIYTPRYDSNAADRVDDSGAASTTALTIDGIGSLLSARSDVGGLFVGSLGDRTSDVTTVKNYGKLDAGKIALATGIGASSTLALSDHATVTTDLLEMGRPFRTGPTTTATLNVLSASEVRCASLVTSSSLSAVTNITVSDPISLLTSSGVAIFGGVSGDALGGGSTSLIIAHGASADFVALEAGGASAAGAGGGYTGTQITLSDAGTQLKLRGSGGLLPAAGDLAANLVLSANTSTKSSVTVASGASLQLLDNDINPNRDGAIAMSIASNTVATLLIDGPGSSIDAGKLIAMAEAPTANAFANASATITVRNGGFLGVYENVADEASGNLQMAIRPSTGSTATLNIGGGAMPDDADTNVAIDGTLFVGGSGDATPVAGGRSTVNVNNGSLAAAAVAIYANSKLVFNGGHVSTDNLMALGGRVDLSSTTPLAMELGAIRASSGGVINLGKGGAVVYYSTANNSPSDLVGIRQLIYNGSNGGAWNGADSITSSLLSVATPRMAIGYADIDAVGITSFLDVSFTPAAQAVAIRYTFRGDANLDGAVNFDDLLILAQNYELATSRDWFQGDFNYLGNVNFDDLLLLAQNYGLSMLSDGGIVLDPGTATRFARDWALARSIVPEPGIIPLVIAGAAVFSRRRRPR